MKKATFLLLSVLMVMASLLVACAGSSTAQHNGKVCPKGSDSKTACNRATGTH
jgi:ABC-type oligopeptide transport system substrate-binding subunit